MMKKRLFGLLAALMVVWGLSVSASAFSDVPAGHWAESAITRCAEAGWLKGESADTFGLGNPMTQGAFVVTLSRFFGWEETAPAAPCTGVEGWYAPAVNAAWAQGILTAPGGGFRPNDPITREEMAVMVIRALGYGPISGLAQGEDLPFTDVTTSRGYLTLAYDFGLLSGTSSAAFSPAAPATREQAAVLLARLGEKLGGSVEKSLAVVTDWEKDSSLGDWDIIALQAARLTASGKKAVCKTTMSMGDLAAVRDAAGRRPILLGVSAGEKVLDLPAEALAAALAEAVEEGYYDGLYLDISGVSAQYRSALTELALQVKAALGEDAFYLAAAAPALNGGGGGGCDLSALAQTADRLMLRPATVVEQVEGFTSAPPAALEECWHALRGVKDLENVTLLLPGEVRAWRNGKEVDTVREVPAGGASWSGRYGCAYYEEDGLTLWYLNEEALAQRQALLALMGRGFMALTAAQSPRLT